ncbi:MAG TPA: tetratricopeptide repeat protein, partial [Cytophagales bacterium]|nr:tetratricopeptide repeat protein [Cytophagales bacterium]
VKDRLAAFVKDDPSNKIARLKLAVTYESLNELDNAEAQYKEVLVLDPTNTMALYNLGIIQYRKALITLNKKDEVKPEERATKGKELDDKYKKTLYESAKSFEEYRKIRPKDDQVKQVLTDIYKRLKRDDMIELLKK